MRDPRDTGTPAEKGPHSDPLREDTTELTDSEVAAPVRWLPPLLVLAACDLASVGLLALGMAQAAYATEIGGPVVPDKYLAISASLAVLAHVGFVARAAAIRRPWLAVAAGVYSLLAAMGYWLLSNAALASIPAFVR